MRKELGRTVLGIAVGVLFCLQSNAADSKYVWCRAQSTGTPEVVFYSDVFPQPENFSAKIGLASAFNDYVNSHYKTDAGRATCREPVGSNTASEARSDRDRDAAGWKRGGDRVEFTEWTY